VMELWDWQNGSTRRSVLVPDSEPTYPNYTGAYFIAVAPVNHLGSDNKPGATDPIPVQVPANVDLTPIVQQMEEIRNMLNEHKESLAALNKTVTDFISNYSPEMKVTFPDYTASIPFGGTIVLKPRI